MLCNHRNQNNQTYPPGYWTIADVCQLLRPNRKTSTRKSNYWNFTLCQQNDAVVKFTLPENQKQIFASQYELYLPTEKQLLDEVNKELESFEEK